MWRFLIVLLSVSSACAQINGVSDWQLAENKIVYTVNDFETDLYVYDLESNYNDRIAINVIGVPPAISEDLKQMFYVKNNQVWCYDFETKESRLYSNEYVSGITAIYTDADRIVGISAVAGLFTLTPELRTLNDGGIVHYAGADKSYIYYFILEPVRTVLYRWTALNGSDFRCAFPVRMAHITWTSLRYNTLRFVQSHSRSIFHLWDIYEYDDVCLPMHVGLPSPPLPERSDGGMIYVADGYPYIYYDKLDIPGAVQCKWANKTLAVCLVVQERAIFVAYNTLTKQHHSVAEVDYNHLTAWEPRDDYIVHVDEKKNRLFKTSFDGKKCVKERAMGNIQLALTDEYIVYSDDATVHYIENDCSASTILANWLRLIYLNISV